MQDVPRRADHFWRKMVIRRFGAQEKVSSGGCFQHAQGGTRTHGGEVPKIADVDPLLIELILRHYAESIVAVRPDK